VATATRPRRKAVRRPRPAAPAPIMRPTTAAPRRASGGAGSAPVTTFAPTTRVGGGGGGAPKRTTGAGAPKSKAGATPATVTVADWCSAVLHSAGIVPTRNAVAIMAAWCQKEGGMVHNGYRWNLLNTSQKSGCYSLPGPFPSFCTFHDGVRATAQTLSYGLYSGVRAALRSGDINRFASAIQAVPWCVSNGVPCPGYGDAIRSIYPATAYQHINLGPPGSKTSVPKVHGSGSSSPAGVGTQAQPASFASGLCHALTSGIPGIPGSGSLGGLVCPGSSPTGYCPGVTLGILHTCIPLTAYLQIAGGVVGLIAGGVLLTVGFGLSSDRVGKAVAAVPGGTAIRAALRSGASRERGAPSEAATRRAPVRPDVDAERESERRARLESAASSRTTRAKLESERVKTARARTSAARARARTARAAPPRATPAREPTRAEVLQMIRSGKARAVKRGGE
jgi:hypothetical protein